MPLATHIIAPSPWQAGDHGDGAAIVDARGYRIASLRFAGSNISARLSPEEAHANQHLMIAAPELVTALQQLVNECRATLGLADLAIKESAGISNLRCLELRIEEAVALLARLPKIAAGGQ